MGKGREVNCDGVTGEVIVKRNVGSVIVTKDAGIDGDSDSRPADWEFLLLVK